DTQPIELKNKMENKLGGQRDAIADENHQLGQANHVTDKIKERTREDNREFWGESST
ncbi:unnamed protein product, partial [Sphenostylis stenocarpa]